MPEPLSCTIDRAPLPEPRKRGPKPIDWPFDQLARGYSATFNRSASSVRRAMYRFKATAAGTGTRFMVRDIGGGRTRVWRVA
jgi:hypothetical protein